MVNTAFVGTGEAGFTCFNEAARKAISLYADEAPLAFIRLAGRGTASLDTFLVGRAFSAFVDVTIAIIILGVACFSWRISALSALVACRFVDQTVTVIVANVAGFFTGFAIKGTRDLAFDAGR